MSLCIILYKLINMHIYNNHCNISPLSLRIKVIATTTTLFLLLLLLYTMSTDINRRMKLHSIYKALHRLL